MKLQKMKKKLKYLVNIYESKQYLERVKILQLKRYKKKQKNYAYENAKYGIYVFFALIFLVLLMLYHNSLMHDHLYLLEEIGKKQGTYDYWYERYTNLIRFQYDRYTHIHHVQFKLPEVCTIEDQLRCIKPSFKPRLSKVAAYLHYKYPYSFYSFWYGKLTSSFMLLFYKILKITLLIVYIYYVILYIIGSVYCYFILNDSINSIFSIKILNKETKKRRTYFFFKLKRKLKNKKNKTIVYIKLSKFGGFKLNKIKSIHLKKLKYKKQIKINMKKIIKNRIVSSYFLNKERKKQIERRKSFLWQIILWIFILSFWSLWTIYDNYCLAITKDVLQNAAYYLSRDCVRLEEIFLQDNKPVAIPPKISWFDYFSNILYKIFFK